MAAKEPTPDTSSASTVTKPPAGPIIFVVGPPGSGKGTLCTRICEKFPGRFRHLSVGDYLRELFSTDAVEALSPKPGSEDSGSGCLPPEEIAKYVQESRLLPPETIIPLIKAKLLSEDPSSGTGWLIDGFPRDIKTALAFEEQIKAPTALIGLGCEPHIARARFLKRQRTASDDEQRFERRLKEYDENWKLLVPYYSKIDCQMHVNSDQDGWINGLLGVPQGEFKELLALTEESKGQ